MRVVMTQKTMLWFALILSVTSTATLAQEELKIEQNTKLFVGWKALAPPAIETTFMNKKLGDGFHYSYRFESNGMLKGTEMGRDVRGSWAVEKNLLCLHREKPRRYIECFKVYANGNQINMMDHGVSVFQGVLSDAD